MGLKDNTKKLTLDLRQVLTFLFSLVSFVKGADIVIPIKDAMNFGCKGKIGGKRNGNSFPFSFPLSFSFVVGDYCCVIYESDGPKSRLLGAWWVEAAIQGKVSQLPIINLQRKIKEEPKKEKIILPNQIKVIQSHHLVVDPESGMIHLSCFFLFSSCI